MTDAQEAHTESAWVSVASLTVLQRELAGIERYEMVVGDSRVQLSEGRVHLNEREWLRKAEGRNRLLGHPIELN